jgi:diguanylate cyclase (GGDEF)-like protein
MEMEKSLSRLDFLTRIPNLKAFHEFGIKEIERCRRNNCKVAIAYMDCGNFKQINDTFDHHVGNKLINTIAQTIQKSIRNVDVAARLSGDEFAIILPNTDTEASNI